jgi:hypothetical protein
MTTAPSSVRRAAGLVAMVLGGTLWLVSGIWGMILCYKILATQFGTLMAIAAMFLAPLALAFAPWLAIFADRYWIPLAVIYGGGFLGAIIFFTGREVREGDAT